MPTPLFSGVSRRLPLALLMLAAAPAALAVTYPKGAVVEHLPSADDPAEKLARALRTLAAEPNDMDALLTAGDNALALGDPNAAVGFFGRAAGIEPRNGKAKAGLGSALIQLERPQEALRQFAEARRLGVSDADLADDRGLAYDLSGEPRKAQRDYALALAQDPDDDTARRRLALSLGISGDRTAALAALDPLIRKRDIAAWRAQTFVLAMTGDAAGAHKITQVMLPQQAAMLQPFLVRLASLTPAQKARAVHFGEMPENGRSYTPSQLANIGPTPTYEPLPSQRTAEAETARPETNDLAPRTGAATTAARAPSRPARAAVHPPARIAAAQPAPQPRRTRPQPQPEPTRTAAIDPNRPLGAIASREAIFALGQPYRMPVKVIRRPTPAATASAPAPAPARPTSTAALTPNPAVKVASRYDESAPAPVPAVTAPPPARPAPAPTRIASATEASVALPTASATGHYDLPHAPKTRPATREVGTPVVHAARRSAKAEEDKSAPAEETKSAKRVRDEADKKTEAHSKKADEEKASGRRSTKSRKGEEGDSASAKEDKTSKSRASEKKSSSSKKKHEEKAPARVYVQVAGGANKDDLDKAWSKVAKKAPELMKGRHPSTTPLRHTNRLLVGPFKNEDEAQAFVNKMAGKGLSGFIFTSEKGQKVEKIDTGK